jgi:molecular chaperone HtpG
VNTNSKLISAIYGMKGKDDNLAKEMLVHVYETALLAQKELEPDALAEFISRSNRLMENLIEKN